MARSLTPADFGLFAMAFTVLGFVSWFRDFGLPLALTQRESRSRP
ncbi:MAG: oligosaccharide flippase family protein [Gemmatimonadetes bacterium]|nr:oligosaccharide flippase family protein [Gemmatimonadota bacterium]